MTRRIIIAAIAASLTLAAPAVASTNPTVAQARHAVRAYDQADSPTSIVVTDCRHHGDAVACRDVESGVVTDWTLDGQPITMTLTSRSTVRMRAGQPHVTSSYVTHIAN